MLCSYSGKFGKDLFLSLNLSKNRKKLRFVWQFWSFCRITHKETPVLNSEFLFFYFYCFFTVKTSLLCRSTRSTLQTKLYHCFDKKKLFDYQRRDYFLKTWVHIFYKFSNVRVWTNLTSFEIIAFSELTIVMLSKIRGWVCREFRGKKLCAYTCWWNSNKYGHGRQKCQKY